MREQRSVELAMTMVRFISAAMASPLYMAYASTRSDRWVRYEDGGNAPGWLPSCVVALPVRMFCVLRLTWM